MKKSTGTNVWHRTLVTIGVGIIAATTARAEDAKPAADTKTEADTTEYNNWITLGVGSPFINGDSAAYMRRQQMNKSVFGGIEDFHWEQNVGKKGLFELNGSGIYDENNYGANFKLSQPDLGYVKAGYEQFRTWYDGSGGYFPAGTNNWFDIYNDELAINRGKAWFEAGLTMPDAPQITFRYEHQFREGSKDSTSWSPTTFGSASTARRIVPAFLGIDEKRDSFALDLKQGFGKTDLSIGVRYTTVDNNDSRNERWYPGATGTTSTTADRYGTERDMLKEDSFNAHAITETRFNDKLKLTMGGSFTTLDTDVSGSRVWGNNYDPVLSSAYASGKTLNDRGFYTGDGSGATVKQYIANLNLVYSPTKDLVIVPSLRIEDETVNGQSIYFQTTTNTVLANAPAQRITADRETLTVTEGLEARYTGFKNWSLYARGEWAQSTQDASEISRTNGLPSSGIISGRSVVNDLESLGQKYTAGANWYPVRGLNMGGQYFYKLNEYRWNHSLPTADIFERGFETHDLNYRLTWRPLSQLSFVSRYDFTLSKINFQAVPGPTEDSAEMTSHIISESINWTPNNRMYVQLNGSYAWDGAMKTLETAKYYNASNSLPNIENGYFTASAIVGYALDEVTDLQLQYTFYKANNYDISDLLYAVPFGTSAEEHGVTATISRQLNKRTKVSLKYGYFNSVDDTSGGHNNYSAHLIYATMQYKF